jgi:hypothetical protein
MRVLHVETSSDLEFSLCPSTVTTTIQRISNFLGELGEGRSFKGKNARGEKNCGEFEGLEVVERKGGEK